MRIIAAIACTLATAALAQWPQQPVKIIVPVTTILTTPVVLVVPSGSPFKTVQELVDFAKKNPGKLNFGSGGVGSSTHLDAEVFKKEAKIDIAHIRDETVRWGTAAREAGVKPE